MSKSRYLENLLTSDMTKLYSNATSENIRVENRSGFVLMDSNEFLVIGNDMFDTDHKVVNINVINKPKISNRERQNNQINPSKSENCLNNAKDIVKSSPCSPTFMDSEIKSKRQRSYSDSRDQLSAQDQACLEEIERGSQFIAEDFELFDYLSKDKLELSTVGHTSKVAKSTESNINKKYDSSTVSVCSGKQSFANVNEFQAVVTSNEELNSMDTLESALIQSSIPVALSHKNVPKNHLKVSLEPNKKKVVQKSVHTVVKDPKQSDIVSSTTIIASNNRKPQSTSGPNTGSSETQNILHVEDLPVVNAATPQTIQKVVVHLDGKEQVFDVSQITGEQQLTIQPITVVPSAEVVPFMLGTGVAMNNGK